MKIEVNSLSDVISKFNSGELSEEFASYLVNKAEFIRESSIKISIKTSMSSKDKERLEKIIHHHFKGHFTRMSVFDRYDGLIRLALLVIGIVLIFVSEQLASVAEELFLIAGWVIVWEVIYDELFNQIKRKRTKRTYEKLSQCQIEYINN